MSDYLCRYCGEPIAEDFLAKAPEEFNCPQCGQTLRLTEVAPELARPDASQFVLEELVEESPPGSRLQCRLNEGQLVLYIPPGSSGQTRFMAFFATFWLIITGIVSSGFIGAMLGNGGGDHGADIFLVLFFGLFWAVGLGMLYLWYRGRFGKTYVLVERDRLVVKFELAKREKFKEYSFTDSSRASLVVSYEQNHQPVYAVSVSTADKPAKFGTFLSQAEKEWIVERINRHLSSPPKAA
jgi:hypothetical protein